MAIKTSKLMICVDTERIPGVVTTVEGNTATPEAETRVRPGGAGKVTAQRVRILNVDTLAELGSSDWLTEVGVREKDAIRLAFDDFYANGGFRSGVKRQDAPAHWVLGTPPHPPSPLRNE